jgi:hypothetical protein
MNLRLKNLIYSPVKLFLNLSLICLVAITFGCSSSGKTQNSGNSGKTITADNKLDNADKNTSENKGNDVDWSMIKDDIASPNKMRKTILEEFASSEPLNEADNYIENRRGFRVQIDFTRDMNVADSLKNQFNYRIRQLNNIDYKAEAYVIYRPPYYRIRVGDFKDRLEALEYTKMLKRYYPASWVVADEINTNFVPKEKSMNSGRSYGTTPPDSSMYRQN